MFEAGAPKAGKAAARASVPARVRPCPPEGAPADRVLAARLQKWVRQTAAAQKVEPFRILSRQTVEAIAAAQPGTFDELQAVKGMGPVKVQKFGRTILDLLAADA
jgi:superfamily II DNA helicase RecQ